LSWAGEDDEYLIRKHLRCNSEKEKTSFSEDLSGYDS
jgi:hypothetical protein